MGLLRHTIAARAKAWNYAVGQGTRGILLADYLKSMLLSPIQAAQKGANLPPDLDAQAKGSSQYAQYCPGQTLWLCRPSELAGTDLTFAFELRLTTMRLRGAAHAQPRAGYRSAITTR